jgi:hypothetical protein
MTTLHAISVVLHTSAICVGSAIKRYQGTEFGKGLPFHKVGKMNPLTGKLAPIYKDGRPEWEKLGFEFDKKGQLQRRDVFWEDFNVQLMEDVVTKFQEY